MCDFCTVAAPLDSVAKESILDEEIDLGFLGTLHEFVLILVDSKELDVCTTVDSNGTITNEFAKHVPIKYCPMCGREL